jgi:hypothetical protein
MRNNHPNNVNFFTYLITTDNKSLRFYIIWLVFKRVDEVIKPTFYGHLSNIFLNII